MATTTPSPGYGLYKNIALPESLIDSLFHEEQLRRTEEVASREKQSQKGTRQTARADAKLSYGERIWGSQLFRCRDPRIQIIDKKEVDSAEPGAVAAVSDSERRNVVSNAFALLRRRGPYRKLTKLRPDWRAALNQLRDDFPNFREVLDYAGALFSIAASGDQTLSLSPMLLNGPPGVGKTYFAEEFAKTFASGFECLRMENAQSNSALCGSDEFWGNTQTGRIFNWFLEREFADPIFILDEIDKIQRGMQYDPLSPLYSLLEPDTARTFRDLSFPRVALDASRIIWICTSNDADSLPNPIQSRLRRFDIPQPSHEEAKRLVVRIFDALKHSIPAIESIELSTEVLDILRSHAPRQVRQLLLEGAGRAIFDGRPTVTGDDVVWDRHGKGGSIGFLSRL